MSPSDAKLQEVYEATRLSYDELYAFLATVPDRAARFRPSESKWSIGELAHHISLAQSRILKAIERFLREAEKSDLGPDPDPTSALGGLDGIRSRAQGKFQAPAEAIPEYGRDLDASVAELRGQQQQLENLLPRLARRDLRQLKFPHPVFGDFDIYQWVLFLGGHASRHRQQMEGLTKDLGYPG